MTDDRANWNRAMTTMAMSMLVHDLIQIGEALGVDVAERMYYALGQEPRDAQGERIDWTQIKVVILSHRSPATTS